MKRPSLKGNWKGFDVKKFGKGAKACWNKNNQVFLAILAGSCAIGAVVEAIRAMPKASKIMEERRDEIDTLTMDLQDGEISAEEFKKETREVNIRAAKEYALTYGTTMALLILSLGSTACNYKISIGKQAALIGAYKALELKSGDFIEKTKEIVGEKKFEDIKSGIIKDQISKADIPDSIKAPEYEKDADGNFLAKQYLYPCWDSYTARPFMSSVSQIDLAMRKAADICCDRNEGSISISDINELLDPNGTYLPRSDAGDTHGFIASTVKDNNYSIPYKTKAIDVPGYDHAFTAIIYTVDPAKLWTDDSCYY